MKFVGVLEEHISSSSSYLLQRGVLIKESGGAEKQVKFCWDQRDSRVTLREVSALQRCPITEVTYLYHHTFCLLTHTVIPNATLSIITCA